MFVFLFCLFKLIKPASFRKISNAFQQNIVAPKKIFFSEINSFSIILTGYRLAERWQVTKNFFLFCKTIYGEDVCWQNIHILLKYSIVCCRYLHQKTENGSQDWNLRFNLKCTGFELQHFFEQQKALSHRTQVALKLKWRGKNFNGIILEA